MALQPTDDVIRIRIDTTQAVDDFLHLLAEQAAEGETREPANPAATAIWREIAPFRLVEYAYIDPSLGPIDGAFIGFPDGALYAVEEDIPDHVVADLVAGCEHRAVPLPPLHVYVLPHRPTPIPAIAAFLTRLSAHIGHCLLGVLPGEDGQMVAWTINADGTRAVAAAETGDHLGRDDILARFAARFRRPDGRAYAALTLSFARHVLEFANEAERDAFVSWSRHLCDWIFAHGGNADALGFAEAYRPAEIAPTPDRDSPTLRIGITMPPPDSPIETMQATWAALRHAIARPPARP